MSEKSANFVPVNDQNLIAVLQAKIAQLTVELADAERKNNSDEQVARMEEFYRKQREDDKAYYEQRLESERLRHKEEVEALRQDIRELKQQHRDEMRQLREESKRISAEQIEEYRRQMQMLNERLAVLDNLAKARELTAEEQKALARFRQSQKYKRSAEQRNLLNRREKEVTREEEKDGWDGSSPGAGNPSDNTADIPADAHAKTNGKKTIRQRKDCRKNVPYTDKPLYVKLEDYYTLPFGAKFVMRNGKIDTWQMRELTYFKRYFWGIKAKALKLCWFLYENGSRGLKAIKPFLDQFIGFFTTDGYVVYKAYDGKDTPNQIRSACLTHIRRGFVDSMEENRELSYWFIDMIGRLFGLEYEYKKRNLSPERRLKERNRDTAGSTKSLMENIWHRLKEFHDSGYKGCGQLMTKALRYAYNEWKAMETVLKNGAVELSNNLAYPNFGITMPNR